MRIIFSILLLVIVFFSCRNRDAAKDTYMKINNTYDSTARADSNDKYSKRGTDVKVSAYLIYNDGTLSTFDVLNDKTIALWNVIAGGGDALKPSDSTKIILDGSADRLHIKIKNGHKLVIDTTVIHFNQHLVYVVKNTGCDEVYVNVIRNNKNIFNDTIPFHCGE